MSYRKNTSIHFFLTDPKVFIQESCCDVEQDVQPFCKQVKT